MALLDMAYKVGIRCHVIHVNYHKRETALRDQRFVEAYCTQHDIDYRVFNAPSCPKGNFQGWARDFRYQKMTERCLALQAQGIMTAHHKDDDLETYLMQIRRKSKVSWYGLKTESQFKETRLIRPLLNVWKTELEAYCLENSIPFGIDESNQSSDYLRNRLRKEIGKLSLEQKTNLLLEKGKRNDHRQAHLNRFGRYLDLNVLSYSDYRSVVEEWPDFLFEWLRLRTRTRDLSSSFMQELNRQINTSASVISRLNPEIRLIKQYGSIRLIPNPVNYEYVLLEPMNLKTPFFECSLEQMDNSEAIPADKGDYPLTIRNALGNETFDTDMGPRKLSRWFISHKIPLESRETWPLVVNAQNELIFIPRCKVKPNAIYANHVLYMLK